VSDARCDLDSVSFDVHSTPATEAALAALQLPVNETQINDQARWESFHDARQALAVRFTRSEKTKHNRLLCSAIDMKAPDGNLRVLPACMIPGILICNQGRGYADF
jgi:hypothetical protein